MVVSLGEAFPDEGGAICKTFFTSNDVTERTWSSVALLAEADDVTLWTVVAHHERLASAIFNLVTAVEQAHSSSSPSQRKSVSRADESALGVILVRIGTSTGVCVSRGVDAGSLARRLETLLPLKSIMPAAQMLLRQSGSTAAVVVTSLFLLNPGLLCRAATHFSSWYDNVARLATRCVAELRRGRFQRLSGDILPFFEQAYRGTKQLWALLQSAPFLADYVNINETLQGLRIIVDVVSPLMQHFLLTCSNLSSRRAVLTKANSMTLNSAVSAACTLTLFRSFLAAGSDTRVWCTPDLVRSTYDGVVEFMERYVTGVPLLLVSNWRRGTLPTLFHQLVPPRQVEDELKVGPLLLTLLDDIPDSKDFSDALLVGRQRFFELFLMELVQQGLRMDTLLSRGLVVTTEAEKLGASEETIACALAGVTDTRPAAAAAPSVSPTVAQPPTPQPVAEASPWLEDPLVAMVMEVFPHFAPQGVRAALNYYNNDVEQFILDASMENLPPHLLTQLTPSAAEAADAALAAALAAQENGQVVAGAGAAPSTSGQEPQAAAEPQQHIGVDDYDTELTDEKLHFYLGGDLYDLITGSDDDDKDTNDDYGDDYATYNHDGDDVAGSTAWNMNEAFDIDESFKEKVRMLNEIMYEDELDDGVFEAVQRTGNRRVDDGESDDDAPVKAAAAPPSTDTAADGGVTSDARRPPRDDYHDKRFHEKRTKERADRVKAVKKERAEKGAEGGGVPAYANKKKTAKQKNSGGQKNALNRALKKGKLPSD